MQGLLFEPRTLYLITLKCSPREFNSVVWTVYKICKGLGFEPQTTTEKITLKCKFLTLPT